eukprot:3326865-Prymnesium_polylepis.1
MGVMPYMAPARGTPPSPPAPSPRRSTCCTHPPAPRAPAILGNAAKGGYPSEGGHVGRGVGGRAAGRGVAMSQRTALAWSSRGA